MRILFTSGAASWTVATIFSKTVGRVLHGLRGSAAYLREAALQESYVAREADLVRRFKEARERLEKDYQDKLNGPGRGG